MRAASAILVATFAGLVALECAVHGDESETIPGRDNPLLTMILAPDMRIAGKWKGLIRRGYEEHRLTVATDPDEKGSYRLKFYTWTDTKGASKTNRTGKLAEGIITLNEPIKGFGISKTPFSVLYTVRADGKDYLLPSVNAAELKTIDDLKPAIAYELQARSEK